MKGFNKYKLIVLDRDGVINADSPSYIKSPDEWHAIPGSLEAITKLNMLGYKVVVISNQSGIARGYFDIKTHELINAKMLKRLAKVGGHLDDVCYCPHHPDDNCECRKPKPKMLKDILEKFNIKPSETLIIGDALCDIELANNIGCDVILVETGKGIYTLKNNVDKLKNIPIFTNLKEVVNLLT